MGGIFSGGGGILGRFETCPYRCLVKGGAIKVGIPGESVVVGWEGGTPSLYLSPGGGEIGKGSIFSGGGEIGAVGLGRGVSPVDSGKSF